MSEETVKIQCPNCERRLKILATKVAKAIVCPKCNTRFKLDQSNSAVVDGENELFGPPISDNYSAGLFEEDIDHLLDDQRESTRKQPKQQEKKKRTRKQLKYGRDAKQGKKGQATGKDADSASSNDAVNEAWNKEKRVTTKFEESLQRNGIGLLILATGLAMIPFFAGNVEGIQEYLSYFPIAAAAIAFLASFMIAQSMRRSNIASILLSGIPFLLICAISLGAYYYISNFVNVAGNDSSAADRVGQVDSDESAAVDPNDDKFTFDADSLDNSPAAKFVPQLKPKPKPQPRTDLDSDGSSDSRTATDNSSSRNPSSRPSSRIGNSELRPNRFPSPPDSGDATETESEVGKDLKTALQISRTSDKTKAIELRLQQSLRKGLVSKGQIRKPSDLSTRYQLSDIAGRSTVYGIAHFSNRPMVGLDAARNLNGLDEGLYLFAPIIDEPEFEDSMVAGDGNSFVGINVHFTDDALVGVQSVFANAQGVESKSDWIGNPPQGNSFKKLRTSASSVLHGVVVYRQQLEAVGLQLIEKRIAE